MSNILLIVFLLEWMFGWGKLFKSSDEFKQFAKYLDDTAAPVPFAF